mmetsp:Transcript_30394/g.66810  ORF Transcript_30394/g.66810 Transcript_30394/m.66810 type:complete len:346 (+) Transcript_30394:141-1178(+)
MGAIEVKIGSHCPVVGDDQHSYDSYSDDDGDDDSVIPPPPPPPRPSQQKHFDQNKRLQNGEWNVATSKPSKLDRTRRKRGIIVVVILIVIAAVASIASLVSTRNPDTMPDASVATTSSIRSEGEKDDYPNKLPDDEVSRSGDSSDVQNAENGIPVPSSVPSAMSSSVPSSKHIKEEDTSAADSALVDDDTEYETRMRKRYSNTVCFDEYECSSDRLSQNERITAGQAICSRDGRLMFGLHHDGTLMWRNCTSGETTTYYNYGSSTDSFVMDETAKFIIYKNDGSVRWELPCNVEVERRAQCYTTPSGGMTYDCPYIHLHRGGSVALNYIDGSSWVANNIRKFYDF